MDKQVFKLTDSSKTRAVIIEAILNAPVGHVVTVQEAIDIRSAAQHRLYWLWNTDCAKTAINEWAGRDKNDWHFDFKKRFLVPIYERDNMNYAMMLAAIRNVWRNGMKQDAETLHKHIVSETSTTDADVKQFTEYLNEISRFCGANGIRLRTDQNLLDLAMGEA
jgi:hypothetical protein